MGLRRLGRQSSQYSRASMLTLRWSMPSWQMSAWKEGRKEEAEEEVEEGGQPEGRAGSLSCQLHVRAAAAAACGTALHPLCEAAPSWLLHPPSAPPDTRVPPPQNPQHMLSHTHTHTKP